MGSGYNIGKKNPKWKGGIGKPYAERLMKRLGRVSCEYIKKDGTMCGKVQNIHVHHKDGNQNNNKVSNLLVVCRKHHHDKFHKRPINLIKLKCDYCQKTFERAPVDVKPYKQHFCSRECQWKFMRQRIRLRCENCGKTIERRPCEIKGKQHHFCSTSCQMKYQWKYGILENRWDKSE